MADGFSTQTQHQAIAKEWVRCGSSLNSLTEPLRPRPITSDSTTGNIRRFRARHNTFPRRFTHKQTSPSLKVAHASPLAPLRSRDAQALDSLFENEQMQAMVLDIHRYMARIYPEPCWEDEPYEFLHGLI